MTSRDPPAASTPSKSTLFCPNCEHQSRYDGDWTLVETSASTRYLCPECGAHITDRPRPTAGPPRALYRPFWRVFSGIVRTVRLFWVGQLPLFSHSPSGLS